MAQAHFSQKQLQNLNNSQLQDKLMLEKNINWNDYSVVEKRGTCVKKISDNWTIDTNIPIFTQDRNYIEETFDFSENK